MGHLLGLPSELLGLITEYLHDDKATLRSLSRVSYALLRPSQAQLFKRVNVWDIHIDDVGSLSDVEEMQKRILLDRGGAQLLSYTRILSLSWRSLCLPAKTGKHFRPPDHVQGRQTARNYLVRHSLRSRSPHVACTSLRALPTDATLPPS